MRRADFGKTPEVKGSTTSGPIFNEPEVFGMVPPDAAGSLGKNHKAGKAVRERALRRYETSKQGGHRDLANTHAPNKGASAYKQSGDEPKGPAHDAGARPVKK